MKNMDMGGMGMSGHGSKIRAHADKAMGGMGGAKKPKLGTGERFANLKGELAAKGARNPGGLAAFIGRKKLGKARFQKLAAKGKASGGGMAGMGM